MKNTNKFILFIFISLLYLNIPKMESQNKNWKKIYESKAKTYDSYHCLKCADSLNCIFYNIYGINGGYYIWRTTDGGNSWLNVFKDTSYFHNDNDYKYVPDVKDLAYPNTKLIVGVGDSGLVIRSTDNGETWEKYNLGKEKNLNVIAMYDENFGYLYAVNYHSDSTFLLRTNDGGLTWSPIPKFKDAGSTGIADMDFLNDNLIYGVFNLNTDFFTIFINNNWQSFDTIPIPYGTRHAHFEDMNNGWAYLGKLLLDSAGWEKWSQIIYGTNDGGLTWQQQRDTVAFNGEPIEDLRFYDKNFGIATSFLGQALITTDGGKNWKEEIIDSFPKNDGFTYYTSDVQFLSSTQALVLCDFLMIYKYTREPTEVAEEPQFKPCNVTLFNNEYENELLLKLECPQKGNVNYIIYNLLGDVILNGSFFKSIYSTTVPVKARLIPGIYFIKAIMDDNTLYYNKFYIIK